MQRHTPPTPVLYSQQPARGETAQRAPKDRHKTFSHYDGSSDGNDDDDDDEDDDHTIKGHRQSSLTDHQRCKCHLDGKNVGMNLASARGAYLSRRAYQSASRANYNRLPLSSCRVCAMSWSGGTTSARTLKQVTALRLILPKVSPAVSWPWRHRWNTLRLYFHVAQRSGRTARGTPWRRARA